MSGGSVAAALGLGLLGSVLIVIIAYIVFAVALWKIFQKLGEPGWKGFIPFLNLYTQYKHTWKTSMFWIWLILIVVSAILSAFAGEDTGSALGIISGIVSIVAAIITIVGYYYLYKSFGHGIGWVILTIFFPHIMLLVLGFGSARYLGNASINKQ